jgi:hypothetical protein
MKDVMFKEGTEAETLGRNGLFKTIGVSVHRLNHRINLNPITSKKVMGRAWTEVPVEHAVEFACAVLKEARHPEAMKALTLISKSEARASTLKVSYRELSTVLAALRLFQGEQDWDGQSRQTIREMPHFLDCEPLDNKEIDDLCERLNCDVDLINYAAHVCLGCKRRFTAEEAESYGFGEGDQPDTCPDCGARLEVTDGPGEVSVKRE